MSAQAEPSTVLYRLYDAAGGLLYVGVTAHWRSRRDQHAKTKPWWGRVESARFERFATRDEALKAETAAIVRQRPEFNVADHPDFVQREKGPGAGI